MSLYHDSEKKWAALLPVLDEHSEWFQHVIRCSFYPSQTRGVAVADTLTVFAAWFAVAQTDKSIQPELTQKLFSLHEDMVKSAGKLVDAGRKSGGVPDYSVFTAFLTLYEEFNQHIRRLEKDFVLENSGYDSFTGLRHKNLMLRDIGREMHRLARQGKKFSLALARLDKFEQMQAQFGNTKADGYIQLVAELIKLSLRSFDDAYYVGGDEFVLCLKQADLAGGISALERLRKELERRDIMIELDGIAVPLSLSCCIAEPVSGDNVEELITNLRADLKETAHVSDAVLQFFELSPLQRYVQDQKPPVKA
ncbi:MAG: diguanylate cyclase [Alphaproteobacteria bacterium]|nr:diguanylate cyclase [Alphaproteobacteria bacterium]